MIQLGGGCTKVGNFNHLARFPPFATSLTVPMTHFKPPPQLAATYQSVEHVGGCSIGR